MHEMHIGDERNQTVEAPVTGSKETPVIGVMVTLHPFVERLLLRDCGPAFIRDLRLAYRWMEREVSDSLIRIESIELEPLWSYHSLPDMSYVLFLDAKSAKLYRRSSVHRSGLVLYYKVSNSEDILREADDNLLRLLLGGIHAFDADRAWKWQNTHLLRDIRNQKLIASYFDAEDPDDFYYECETALRQSGFFSFS